MKSGDGIVNCSEKLNKDVSKLFFLNIFQHRTIFSFFFQTHASTQAPRFSKNYANLLLSFFSSLSPHLFIRVSPGLLFIPIPATIRLEIGGRRGDGEETANIIFKNIYIHSTFLAFVNPPVFV